MRIKSSRNIGRCGNFLENCWLLQNDRILKVINWSISKRDKCELECGLHLLMWLRARTFINVLQGTPCDSLRRRWKSLEAAPKCINSHKSKLNSRMINALLVGQTAIRRYARRCIVHCSTRCNSGFPRKLHDPVRRINFAHLAESGLANLCIFVKSAVAFFKPVSPKILFDGIDNVKYFRVFFFFVLYK